MIFLAVFQALKNPLVKYLVALALFLGVILWGGYEHSKAARVQVQFQQTQQALVESKRTVKTLLDLDALKESTVTLNVQFKSLADAKLQKDVLVIQQAKDSCLDQKVPNEILDAIR